MAGTGAVASLRRGAGGAVAAGDGDIVSSLKLVRFEQDEAIEVAELALNADQEDELLSTEEVRDMRLEKGVEAASADRVEGVEESSRRIGESSAPDSYDEARSDEVGVLGAARSASRLIETRPFESTDAACSRKAGHSKGASDFMAASSGSDWGVSGAVAVSYTHLTLPTIYSV